MRALGLFRRRPEVTRAGRRRPRSQRERGSVLRRGPRARTLSGPRTGAPFAWSAHGPLMFIRHWLTQCWCGLYHSQAVGVTTLTAGSSQEGRKENNVALAAKRPVRW